MFKNQLNKKLATNLNAFVLLSLFLFIFINWEATFAVQVEIGNVATPDSHATKIAQQILSAGGNAVDAGVAAMFTLALVQPYSTGLGGGGLMTLYLNKKAQIIDFREAAALSVEPNAYYQNAEDFQTGSLIGWNSICVPGMVAGAAKALQDFGTKKFDEILQPVIQLAETGFPVSQSLSRLLVKYYDHLEADRNAAAIFFPEWLPIKTGEILKRPDLALTFKTIAAQGSEFFYQVEIADKIAEEMKLNNGLIRLPDLSEYKAKISKSIQQKYKQYEIHAAPPPSNTGFVVVELLKILEKFNLKYYPPNSGDYIHLFIEAYKMALTDRAKYLTEVADNKEINLEQPFREENISKIAKEIDPSIVHANINLINSAIDIQAGSQISIVDNFGNAVSISQSLNQFFGSGIILEDYGVLFNNAMNNFSRAPNKKNSIKPGSRPLISLAPTIILLNEDPFLIIGGSGGERSIITMVQFIVNIIENNLSPEEAMFAPRFCYNYLDDTIEMESRIDSESIDYLKSVGYKIKLMNSYDIYFGNIQAVWYDMSNGQYQANSDVRQEEVVFFR